MSPEYLFAYERIVSSFFLNVNIMRSIFLFEWKEKTSSNVGG